MCKKLRKWFSEQCLGVDFERYVFFREDIQRKNQLIKIIFYDNYNTSI